MTTHSIEFNFHSRTDRVISWSEVHHSMDSGKHCWIDVDTTDKEKARGILTDLGLKAHAMEVVLERSSVGRHDVYDECLHVSLAVPSLVDGRVTMAAIELVLGERFMLTLHQGDSPMLLGIRETYQTFFRKFAQSLGFLLFEVWDALIDAYRQVLRAIEDEVEKTQRYIFEDATDAIFAHVSELTDDLLHMRKNVLALREALDQLSTHKSAFVAESAQPYLRNMVGTLDRLVNDLTVEREILAETLTLYLGIVSHRTNRLLHRLTVVSVIFMPLMFLCGIYGMNFKVMPELEWSAGYGFFWILATICLICTIILTRTRRLW